MRAATMARGEGEGVVLGVGLGLAGGAGVELAVRGGPCGGDR